MSDASFRECYHQPLCKAKSVCRSREIYRRGLCIGVFLILTCIVWSVLKRSYNLGLTASTKNFSIPEPGPNYVSRSTWGAVDPQRAPLAIDPATLAVIKHTGGTMCLSNEACRARVHKIQKDHINNKNFSDISYNFLIGGDEMIYVGRGWGTQNEGRADSLDIAFIGNFSEDVPTANMMDLALVILLEGPWKDGLNYDQYHVINHNQTEVTDSPGAHLFRAVVAHLPHYSSKVCYSVDEKTSDIIVAYDCP